VPLRWNPAMINWSLKILRPLPHGLAGHYTN
jgi:hypothetical protein